MSSLLRRSELCYLVGSSDAYRCVDVKLREQDTVHVS